MKIVSNCGHESMRVAACLQCVVERRIRIAELENKLEATTKQLGEADVENQRLQDRLDAELGHISLD